MSESWEPAEQDIRNVRFEALADINAERDRQDAKWGGPAHDQIHGPEEWFVLISKQMGQLSSEIIGHPQTAMDPNEVREWFERMRHQLTQVAALACVFMEQIDLKLVTMEERKKEKSNGGGIQTD